MATDENQVRESLFLSVQSLYCVFALSGHGEQENFDGHDVEDRCQPALQTIYFPHTTEHEVKSFSGVNVKL